MLRGLLMALFVVPLLGADAIDAPPTASPAPIETAPATLVAGGGPVAVVRVTYVPSADVRAALGSRPVTYVVCTIDLTDDTSAMLYPVIAHFALVDRTGIRYVGVDSGSTALLGGNDLRPIPPGQTRRLVVGFRAEATTMGTVRYDY